MDVRTLSLGVLTHGPMSGYDIKKSLENDFRHVVSAGYGSIYPALAELAAEDLVTIETVPQGKRPDKKVYAITGRGRERLVADLVATEGRHRVRSEFLVLMYFADLLPPEKVAATLDKMMASLEHWVVEGLDACERQRRGPGGEPPGAGVRFALGYGRAVTSAALDYMKNVRDPFLRELEAGAAARRAHGSVPAPPLPAPKAAE